MEVAVQHEQRAAGLGTLFVPTQTSCALLAPRDFSKC